MLLRLSYFGLRNNFVKLFSSMAETIVEVNQGKLKGQLKQTAKKIYSFKSIPYAKPPLGNLRFRAPEPADPWEGVLDATRECSISAQYDAATDTCVGDEDCLYLNVYTPKLPEEVHSPLPVMVFFHGGGFVFGSGTDSKVHGPDYLVDKDVVLVSINYRLGILGFLNLDMKESSGNMGLKDQVLALKWVQQNISKFSGDPNNVTIFGVSAGGASVEYHLLSPMSKGLFHKAIAQSGSSLLHWAQNKDMLKFAWKIPSFLKLNGSTVDNKLALFNLLKGLPMKELVSSAFKAVATENTSNMTFGFVPSIENPEFPDTFLAESPYVLLEKGEFTKVPYITGFTSHEGLLMICVRKPLFDALVKEKNFVKNLPFKLDETENEEMERRFKEVYLNDKKTTEDTSDFAVDFYTDIDFLGGIYVAAKLIAKNNSPVYLYEFAYDGALNYLKNKFNLKRKGACHGDDGGYIIKAEGDTELSPTDVQVKEQMVTMWTNFAKSGNPTPEINSLITSKWKPMDEATSYLQIGDQLTMKENPYPERMKVFNELFEKIKSA